MNTLALLGFDNPVVRLLMKLDARKFGCRLLCGPYAWDLTKDSRAIRIGRRQFASVRHLASQFDALFETLSASGENLLDFSRIQVHTYRASGISFELAQWPEADAAIESYFEHYEPSAADLVFDLGAECGVFTYALSVRSGSVVAFEPDVHMRVILERNVTRHGLANVTVARDSVVSLDALIKLYGQPVFCRVNLDAVGPEFFGKDSAAWMIKPIRFAARSKSRRIRKHFVTLLEAGGFETKTDGSMGMLWAQRRDPR